MIFFLTTRRNRYPIDRYMASWGQRFQGAVQPLAYGDLLRYRRRLPGVYFFSDLELIRPDRRARVIGLWHELRALGPDVVLFNHPGESLRRYDLLRTLHREGMNRFNVHRLDEDPSRVRYPAFVRGENDHYGSHDRTVHGPEELAGVISQLPHRRPDRPWIITEYCDTSDESGVFRKYSAFLLDGVVIPRHVFFSRAWCLKLQDLVTESYLAEERSYMSTNPHGEEILRAFRLARLDYGRIDYGIQADRIQVWEINTNPMILSFESYSESRRLEFHEAFSSRFAQVMGALALGHPGNLPENYPGQRAFSALRYRYERPGVRPWAHPWVRRYMRLEKRLRNFASRPRP